MAMVIELRAEDTIKIVTNGCVEITLDGKHGKRARLILEGEPKPQVSVLRDLSGKDKDQA